MATNGSHEVLRDMDSSLRCCPRHRQILDMHDHSAHRLHEERSSHHGLHPVGCYMGFLLHHVYRYFTLLSSTKGNVGHTAHTEREGQLCAGRYVYHHRTHCYRQHYMHGPRVGRRTSDNAVEYADEEAVQATSFWVAVIRVCVSTMIATSILKR